MRKTTLLAITASLACILSTNLQAQQTYEPSGTYLFARKDTCDLYMDIYNPAAGSVTQTDGIDKPSILFMFGGGFFSGSRNDPSYLPWYRTLNEEGYRVIAIDYRLGLRNVGKAGINAHFIKNLRKAIDLAVEDLYSATNFIIENAEELGIDPAGIVISGSSAGAITSLQAEWEICNGTDIAAALPQDFNYAGVMAFSGAIFSDEGSIKFKKKEPCPMMLCHGTADNIVPYTLIQAFNLCFAGTDPIAETLEKENRNYNIYRFSDHGHDIAMAMPAIIGEELSFLETNVTRGIRKNIDATVDDERMVIPAWAKARFTALFKKSGSGQ